MTKLKLSWTDTITAKHEAVVDVNELRRKLAAWVDDGDDFADYTPDELVMTATDEGFISEFLAPHTGEPKCEYIDDRQLTSVEVVTFADVGVVTDNESEEQ